MKHRNVALATLLAAALFAGWVLLYPSPITAYAYTPSQALPFEGVLAVNDKLRSATLIPLPQGLRGGEDVAIDQRGCVHTGTDNGDILRQCPDSGWETLANTGGRPLGLAFDSEENLIIADAEKGLLLLDPALTLQTLVDQFDGKPLGLADDLDIADDGTIYFSDATLYFELDQGNFEGLSGNPSGRLFSFYPKEKTLSLLADNLYFANGVAVSKDQQFVLVNESYGYRTMRVWLTPERYGQTEIFSEKFPGFPDGIATADDGTFWLTFYLPRSEVLDLIHTMPFIKELAAKLPQWTVPRPTHYGLIAQLNQNGEIIQSFHDETAQTLGGITSVQPEKDKLYIGTLEGPNIASLSY
ncbi:gluconolactonase [Veronia nyctiphanis]|uniref:Gluconolactonase n=1 Tax=Veronia nyctiphanis TaxID=1278244 RepID=A0A4Q0YL96_9GAMM|nr:SMP-30/gluconolactonase/LRE family protein [Veronia nyctiphanis]RXJ71530.1 gluconolactonase [Veronia nyctiphanis]